MIKAFKQKREKEGKKFKIRKKIYGLNKKMKNFKIFLCVLIIVEVVHFIDAKRSFGITGRRSKSKSPSVRRGQHGHDSDDHIPVPRPPPPASNKNIGWNTNQAHNTHNAPSAPPLNPGAPNLYSGSHHQPPPYGMHQSYGAHPPAYGAPPAYSAGPHHSYGGPPPAYGAPPAYSAGFNQPKPIFGQNPAHGAPYGNMMSGGTPMGMNMGMPMMGVMPMQTQQRSNFGGGIMTNLFAGLAGYQLAKAFSGGNGYHQRDRDVLIINNPPAQTVVTDGSAPIVALNQPPVPVPVSDAYPHTPLNSPPSQASSSTSSSDESTETSSHATQLVPRNNEYNYWGFPQYGVPLYGYNLPSQITEYYQIDTIKLNHDSQRQEATS